MSLLPKLRKEQRDEVIQYINDEFTDIEIHEKTGRARSTIASVRKELSSKKNIDSIKEKPTSHESYLSEESIKKIGIMMGMYGAANTDEAINAIFEDIKGLTKLKYKYVKDVNKSLREVFYDLSDYSDKLKHIVGSLSKLSDELEQFIILRSWGMDWAVLAFYDLTRILRQSDVSLMDFLNDAVILSFKELGHDVEYYWNDEFKDNLPILISPKGGRVKWPDKFRE